jgi:phosphoserine phosphatase
MDRKDEEVRDVYAYYGLAMYWASCLEQSIFQHLLFFEHFPKALASYKDVEKWEKEFDEFESKEMKQTMGRLVRRLKEAGQPTKEIEASLDKLLAARNWLVHSYFPDRAVHFTLSDGRMEMIDELIKLRDQFIECAGAIDELSKPVLEKYGFTEEFQQKVLEQLVNEHRQKSRNA